MRVIHSLVNGPRCFEGVSQIPLVSLSATFYVWLSELAGKFAVHGIGQQRVWLCICWGPGVLAYPSKGVVNAEWEGRAEMPAFSEHSCLPPLLCLLLCVCPDTGCHTSSTAGSVPLRCSSKGEVLWQRWHHRLLPRQLCFCCAGQQMQELEVRDSYRVIWLQGGWSQSKVWSLIGHATRSLWAVLGPTVRMTFTAPTRNHPLCPKQSFL